MHTSFHESTENLFCSIFGARRGSRRPRTSITDLNVKFVFTDDEHDWYVRLVAEGRNGSDARLRFYKGHRGSTKTYAGDHGALFLLRVNPELPLYVGGIWRISPRGLEEIRTWLRSLDLEEMLFF